MSTQAMQQVYRNPQYLEYSVKDILDYMDQFYSYLDVATSTIQTYQRALAQFVAWIKRENIEEPSRADIISYRNALQDLYSANTVNSYLTPVRKFFEWTAVLGVYPNIAANIKGTKTNKTPRKEHLSINQAKDVISEADNARDHALLALLFTTGLRTIEIVRANIDDVFVSGGFVKLYVQGKGHDDKDMFVKIPPKTERLIREWIRQAPDKSKGAPLFQSLSNNNHGGRMTTRSVRRTVKKYFKDAGFESERLTTHSTRHTAITAARQLGLDGVELQQFARHESFETTTIYIHNVAAESNKGSELLEQALLQ